MIDARGNTVMQYDYDMVSQQAHQTSMDAGERWMLKDVMNKPLYKWDSRDQRMRMEYDDLHRPTNQWLTQNVSQLSQAEIDKLIIKNTPQNQSEKLIGVTVCGENQTLNGNTDIQLNLRGKPFQLYDQSGLVQTSAYDFKGNVKTTCKQLTSDYKNIVDWYVPNKTALLEKETFNHAGKFDATNKAVEMDMPDGSKIYPFYNLTNSLKQIDVFVGSKGTTVSFVQNIDYNAKGQRQRILYGNNTTTGYTYEETTYRLSRLLTTRNIGADIMQDLNYTYDPVGNITEIIDHAQQTIYFNNAAVDPNSQYTYDAIYRLIDARGREHAGQNKACDQFDTDKTQAAPGKGLLLPGEGDIKAMQRYEQQYEYDSVGNMLKMIHNAGNGVLTNRWTRSFEYNNDDTARTNNNVAGGTQKNNQLLNEYTGARGPASNSKYIFDAYGNILNLQKGSYNLTWNYADQLQQVNLGGGGTAYYVYDAGGQRIRKVIENGGLVKERIYLSSHEVYRETNNGTVQLERETLHIMDDKSRIAMVETVTQGSDKGLPFLIRYHYGNHLGSSCIELAGTLNAADKTFVAPVISYEEYYPYGSTAYQAMDNQMETAKRYCYTGMERDAESGLEYHSARYYMPWLGRWLNCDPLGLKDGPNLYLYSLNNPVIQKDTTGLETETPKRTMVYDRDDKLTGKETSAEVHIWAREHGYDFKGKPVWTGKNFAIKDGGIYKIAQPSSNQADAENKTKKVGSSVDTTKEKEFFKGLLKGAAKGFIGGLLFGGVAAISSMAATAVGAVGIGLLTYNTIKWAKSGFPISSEGVGDFIGSGISAGIGVQAGMSAVRGLKNIVNFSNDFANGVSSAVDSYAKEIEPQLPKPVSEATNRAQHEAYKAELRSQMEKPYVVNKSLKKIVDNSYAAERSESRIGNGSEAAAIFNELATLQSTKGSWHIQEGGETIIKLSEWLKNNPSANPGDRAAAENIIKQIRNALGHVF